MGHIKDRWYSGKGDAKKPTARHGKGLRWQIWYTVDGREKCGGSFAVKAVAQKKLLELESSVLRGAWIDPTNTTTVAEWVRQHTAIKTLRPGTVARVDSYIRVHIEGTPLGARRLSKVRPSEAQGWVSDRAEHLAPITLRLLVRLVRGAYAAAVHDRLATENPFARVTLPKVERERIVPLTVEQVLAIVAEVNRPYRALFKTQAGLGLRIGEVLALRVCDVDFLRREVRVVHQVDRVTRELVVPKTPRSKRTIPLPRMVAEALAEHLAEFPPTADGLIFHTEAGRPHGAVRINNRVFVPAALRAGLPPGTTTHALRHHYASVLLAAGESVVAVADRLGHDSADLVLSTYGHLMPNLEDRTRKAVDAAWDAATQPASDSATAQGRPK